MKEQKEWAITTKISDKAKKNVDVYQRNFNQVHKAKITKMVALSMMLEEYKV